MLRFLAERAGVAGRGLRQRARHALCLAEMSSDSNPGSRSLERQRGSAVVEFTFLAILLMVPLVYFVVTIGQIQGASFGVVGAADQAAKVFVTQADPARAKLATEQSVVVALADYGHTAEQATVEIACDQEDCLAAGASVTVTVRLDVPLPMVPFGDKLHLDASRLSSSATQIVGRFQ
jgi:Flp pilus assembly protein TadG